MAKHAAPSTPARIRAALRPDPTTEHAVGRVGVVTLAGIFVALLLLIGVGTANATAPAAPTTPAAAGPHRVDLHLPVVPLPERTGAGTDLPAAPADPLAALVADGAGSRDDVDAAAASLCGDDTAPTRLAAQGWTDDQVTALIDAVDCD